MLEDIYVHCILHTQYKLNVIVLKTFLTNMQRSKIQSIIRKHEKYSKGTEYITPLKFNILMKRKEIYWNQQILNVIIIY